MKKSINDCCSALRLDENSILLIMFLTVLISIFFIRCYPDEEQKQIPTSTTNIQTANAIEAEADSLYNIE